MAKRRNFEEYLKQHFKKVSVDEEIEEVKSKGFSKAKKGLVGLGAIGCGMYFISLGQTLSYKRGFRDGEIFANDQFRSLAERMIEVIDKSEG